MARTPQGVIGLIVRPFSYINGQLNAEKIPLSRIAAEVGTPVYVYSRSGIEERFIALEAALAKHTPLIAYAMKANSNQAILTLLAKLGAGADIVSGGELERAIAAGIPAQKIVFSGVAKTTAEITRALELDILCFNVESEAELERLNTVAGDMGKTARVSLRINPDVDAKTHAKISTGKAADKFGIPYLRAREVYARIGELPHLAAHGVDMHIGSQITDMEPFTKAFALLTDLVRDLRSDGHTISHVDLGGGLGISYDGLPGPDLSAYADITKKLTQDLGCQLVLEPGRFLVGNAGALLTTIEYVKTGAHNFVIVDAGMNDLLRPTLYEAEHDILPLTQSDQTTLKADIVGPVCETGDYLAKGYTLPNVQQGDVLAVMDAGAYGAVMASNYNSRALVPEVLVDGNAFHVIRPRQEIAALIALDQVPADL